MAARSLSPTAQLLRSSRLFSVPPVLPYTSNSNVKSESQTATQPYPTRQAIATTDSALHGGDWGLKRALPKNAATSTSQPTIRILSSDTVEQVTDFESAQDHAKTLQKWQEMDIPMLTSRKRAHVTGNLVENAGNSVFNIWTDNTSKRRTEKLTQRLNQTRSTALNNPVKAERWKVEGPNMVDMTEGDFNSWLQKVVAQPSFKRQFLDWLKKRVIEREIAGMRAIHNAEAAEASTQGPVADFDEAAARQSKDWEQVFRDRLHLMRGSIGPDGELNKYLEEFLDLPQRSTNFNPRRGVQLTSDTNTYTTHPSAGLSYLKNKSFLPSHPIYGPRADYEPVRARQLNVSGHSALGVGGVTATDPSAAVMSQNYDKPGGTKKWVTPLGASINEEGRIWLRIAAARATSTQVKEEDMKETLRRRGELQEDTEPSITTADEWRKANIPAALL